MKYTLFIIGILFFFSACDKEDALESSYLEKDWFTPRDNPNDPLQHRAFEIFTKWEIPVFYNDTIGRQDRGTDRKGRPLVFYKVLDLNYNLNNPENVYSLKDKHSSLIKDEDDIMAGIDFIDQKLLPVLPEQFYIHSILLLDSLYEDNWGTKTHFNVYASLEALAVAGVPDIAAMTEDEQKDRANEIAVYLTVNYLAGHESEELEAFRRESYDPVLEKSIYGLNVCPPRYPGYICVPPDRWEVYGFLDYDRTKYNSLSDPDPANWRYTLLKEEKDIETYIDAVLSWNENDFITQYAAYSKVLKKYRIIRGILLDIGFKLQ